MALSVGHPRGTHSRYMIGCCVIPLEICGVKNNSRPANYLWNRVCMGDAFSFPCILSCSAVTNLKYVDDVCRRRCYEAFNGLMQNRDGDL